MSAVFSFLELHNFSYIFLSWDCRIHLTLVVMCFWGVFIFVYALLPFGSQLSAQTRCSADHIVWNLKGFVFFLWPYLESHANTLFPSQHLLAIVCLPWHTLLYLLKYFYSLLRLRQQQVKALISTNIPLNSGRLIWIYFLAAVCLNYISAQLAMMSIATKIPENPAVWFPMSRKMSATCIRMSYKKIHFDSGKAFLLVFCLCAMPSIATTI